jgi:hypothetical protein
VPWYKVLGFFVLVAAVYVAVQYAMSGSLNIPNPLDLIPDVEVKP